jgi:hypothetical protein
MAAKKTTVKAPAKKRTAGKVVPKKTRKVTDFTHGIHGNRGTVWPEAWAKLAEAYGGNYKLAAEVGVSYNTLYRWAVNGDVVPPSSAKLLAIMAGAKGIPSPIPSK